MTEAPRPRPCSICGGPAVLHLEITPPKDWDEPPVAIHLCKEHCGLLGTVMREIDSRLEALVP